MAENLQTVLSDALEKDALTAEAMQGIPEFYDIPDELQQVIEKATLIKERMFWLRATHIKQDIANTQLLRRAVYAECRCWEMENQAAEMALITSGAADRVRELEAQLDKLSKATS
ncbi:MAG TPA: hypothetical protein ENH62_05815 [Marinobacter sp.]|nr:hypothetical protein [Marinobacter sp.]